jgi:hypothetical protein
VLPLSFSIFLTSHISIKLQSIGEAFFGDLFENLVFGMIYKQKKQKKTIFSKCCENTWADV